MKINNKVFYIPAILIAILIFILSSIEQVPFIDLGFEFKDKILHFIAYSAFGSSLIIGFVRNIENWSRNQIVIIVLLIGAFYGASDEIHQLFVPGRSCDIADWYADLAGILFSLLFIKFFDNLTFRILARITKGIDE